MIKISTNFCSNRTTISRSGPIKVKLNQFGFQKNKNTSDAILEFLENIYESFNENDYYLSMLLNFSKAFDTISHDILLNKLEFMEFRGP